eukprot:5342879-Lingulodinium_polyedra.AAC.1
MQRGRRLRPCLRWTARSSLQALLCPDRAAAPCPAGREHVGERETVTFGVRYRDRDDPTVVL